MDERAIQIVEDYINAYYEGVAYDTYIVWKCKTIQNWKYLISTTLHDGRYYELTYNGDEKEWYLDVYKKHDKIVIKEK